MPPLTRGQARKAATGALTSAPTTDLAAVTSTNQNPRKRRITSAAHSGPQAKRSKNTSSGLTSNQSTFTEQTSTEGRISPLEMLPNELLQKIFVLSGNPAFALIDRLGTRLSTEATYLPMMLRIFGNPWDRESSATHLKRPASIILQSHWFSLDWVKKFVEYTRPLPRDSYRLYPQEDEKNKHVAEEKTSTRMLTAIMGMEENECWRFRNFEFIGPIWRHVQQQRHVDLPVKLLRGPWTAEKVNLLHFLMYCSDPMICWWADCNVLFDGFLEAVKEEEAEVVGFFMEMVNLHCSRSKNPEEFLLQVILRPECSVDMMEFLMDSYMSQWLETHEERWKYWYYPGPLDCNHLDKKIGDWAQQESESYNRKAVELKKLLRLKPLEWVARIQTHRVFGY